MRDKKGIMSTGDTYRAEKSTHSTKKGIYSHRGMKKAHKGIKTDFGTKTGTCDMCVSVVGLFGVKNGIV